MAKINLLPIDLSPKSDLARLANIIKKLTIVASAIFLVLGLAAAGFLIVMTFQADNLVKENQALTARISAFNQEEQSLVLVKDRVKKAQTIMAERKLESELADISPLGQEVMDSLRSSIYKTRIPAGLPEGVGVGNKTGEYHGYLNDAAIVFHDDLTYVICVLSYGARGDQVPAARSNVHNSSRSGPPPCRRRRSRRES